MTEALSEVVLRARNLSFTYQHASSTRRQLNTLADINFDLLRGETLGVVGRNGSGKSTLLRLLAGILAPSSGGIIKEDGLKCGLLALGVGFMQDLTGRDNVIVSLLLQGFSEGAALELLPKIEQFSDLGDAFYDRVKTYSAGMRARLTFSSALYCPNDVLLVDEVLSVGDGDFRVKAREALAGKITGEQTVVFVSHSEAAIKEFCRRVIWIDDGQIKLLGEVDAVMEQYQASYEA